MPKSDKLKLLIIGPGAASNFISSRIMNANEMRIDSDTNEYHNMRDYSEMTDSALLDYINKNTVKKPHTMRSLERVAKLLDSCDWETGENSPTVIGNEYTIAIDKIKESWETCEHNRRAVFWLETLYKGMHRFKNITKHIDISDNSDWWKEAERFIFDWQLAGWSMHYKEDSKLHSIEHYLSKNKTVVDKIAEIVNIGVLHVDGTTTSFVTDILNMKHMPDNIKNNLEPIYVPLSPNTYEMGWADLILDYKKLFLYNDPKELYNLFDFFDKGKYFKDNEKKEINAFRDYHIRNVNYYVDNWEQNSEEAK